MITYLTKLKINETKFYNIWIKSTVTLHNINLNEYKTCLLIWYSSQFYILILIIFVICVSSPTPFNMVSFLTLSIHLILPIPFHILASYSTTLHTKHSPVSSDLYPNTHIIVFSFGFSSLPHSCLHHSVQSHVLCIKDEV